MRYSFNFESFTFYPIEIVTDKEKKWWKISNYPQKKVKYYEEKINKTTVIQTYKNTALFFQYVSDSWELI